MTSPKHTNFLTHTTKEGATVNAEQSAKPQSRRTATAASNRTGVFAMLRALFGSKGSGAPSAGPGEKTSAPSIGSDPRSERGGRPTGPKLLVVTVASLGALAAFAPAISSAAPVFTGAFPNTFTFKTTSLKLRTPENLEASMNCTGLSGGGSINNVTEGTFSAELSGCNVFGLLTCEAPGGGNPKFEGALEIVQINPTTVGVVLTPKELLFSCESVPVKFRGAVLGTISPTGSNTTLFTVTLAREGEQQKYRECELGVQCGKTIQLEGSAAESAFHPAWLESTQQFTTTHATSIIKRPIFTGAFPNTFTFKSTSTKFIEGEFGLPVKCTGLSGGGSVTSATEGTFSSELTGCTFLGLSCTAGGGGSTPKLEGSFELVQINPTTVGVVLLPKELNFGCPGESVEESIKFRGAVLAPISPTGVLAASYTWTFATEAKHQKYLECETGSHCGKVLQLESSLEGKPFVAARFEATIGLTTSKATKIN